MFAGFPLAGAPYAGMLLVAGVAGGKPGHVGNDVTKAGGVRTIPPKRGEVTEP